MRSLLPIAAFAVALGLTQSGIAWAHGGVEPGANPWRAWSFDLDIVLPVLLVAGAYLAGARRRSGGLLALRGWRHLFFFVGLTAIYLALQSPLDLLSERVFVLHQVQHLLLRFIGPMFLFLSVPQACLITGTPVAVRERVLGPVLRGSAATTLRVPFTVLTNPAVATALFVGVLYFWQIPRYQDLAVLNDGVHYGMHASLLLTGLAFFWRVFDMRPSPKGTRYGIRLMMLWLMILTNIILGSFLALKKAPLYSSYDEIGRLWLPALADELLGGATIWMPGSMMGVVAALIVIHRWGREETKAQGRRQRGQPTTATELRARANPNNRAMAVGFLAFVLVVFGAAVLIGVIGITTASA